MKIQSISDIHGRVLSEIVEESSDVLLICGDISPVDLDHSFYIQRQWFYDTFVPDLESLKDKVGNIVFIGGNHDTFLYERFISDKQDVSGFNEELPNFIHYLADSEVEIDGVRIYGTPWCNLPAWGESGPPVWNFAASDFDLFEVYRKIPEGLDILISHGPAFGFCDIILEYDDKERLGSKELLNRILSLKGKPKYVLSGHIHSASHKIEKYVGKDIHNPEDVRFCCVSVLDESYSLAHKPFVFEI